MKDIPQTQDPEPDGRLHTTNQRSHGNIGARPVGCVITVEIAAGELLDKITILRMKVGRLIDPVRLVHVQTELSALEAARARWIPDLAILDVLMHELTNVNKVIWHAEDQLRACEAVGKFDHEFVRLARSIYIHNDRRASLKRYIDSILGSQVYEEKIYPEYSQLDLAVGRHNLDENGE